MREKLLRADAIRLISLAREAVCEKDSLQEFVNDYDAATVSEALAEAYDGVSNGFLSQICQAILGRKVEVIGEPALRFPCPCCRRRTLSELYDANEGTGYGICDYCDWEDDGTVDDEVISSVNKGSMAQYRARIREESNYYFCEKWST